MPYWKNLKSLSPTTLCEARALCHNAVQFVTRAARANLPERADDSHSSMGWDPQNRALVSHEIPRALTTVKVGLRLDTLTLLLLQGEDVLEAHPLDGQNRQEIQTWLDERLNALCLRECADVELPYAGITEHDVSRGGAFSTASNAPALTALSAWFQLADALLRQLRESMLPVYPDTSDVRCWPHHFDIATLISLPAVPQMDARTIGVGLSPGDTTYPQPYFYVTPWPYPAIPPKEPLPMGHWRTEGFTAAIATGEDVLSAPGGEATLRQFLARSVESCHQLLTEVHA